MKKNNKMTAQKKAGIISTASTLVVVLCLIAANLISALVTEKYPVKIDLTGTQAFNLTQQSVDYIHSIDKDIKITVLNTRDQFASGDRYFEQAITVIEQYAKLSDNISLEFLDLTANPTLSNQFGDLSVSVSDIVVECGENRQKLTVYDLFNIEQSWYGGSIASSKAEQAVTGAIMNVSTDVKPHVVILSGHDEMDSSAFQGLLTKNGYAVSSMTLQTDEIPTDAQILIAVAPKRDFDAASIAKLDKYMSTAGGNGNNLLYFASNAQGATPNIDAWLTKWGISVDSGMVAETSQNRVMSNNAFFGVATIDDFSVTGNMSSAEVPIAAPLCRPVTTLFTNSSGFAPQPLLSYSKTSGIVDSSVASLNDVVISGPVVVAAKSVYTNDDTTSTMYVFGSDALIDSNLFDNSSLSNMDYFLSLMSVAANRQDTFIIAPKVLGGGSFSMVQSHVLLFTLLFTVLIPLSVIICGTTIWAKRKRR